MEEILDTGSEQSGPEDTVLHHEFSEHVGLLLDVIPDKQREILVLRIGMGLSANETAQALGSTPSAVRVAQHRALTTLRTAVTLLDRRDTGREDASAARLGRSGIAV